MYPGGSSRELVGILAGYPVLVNGSSPIYGLEINSLQYGQGNQSNLWLQVNLKTYVVKKKFVLAKMKTMVC